MTAPVDTDRIRAVVSALPGVVRVHGHGPNGVAADSAEVEVHVIARYGEALPDLGARVDDAVAPLLGGRSLLLVVDDLATDDEGDDDPTTGDTTPELPAAAPGAPALTAAPEVPALPPGPIGTGPSHP